MKMKTKVEDGWRVLVDPTGAYQVCDPVGTSYALVKIHNGKVVHREKPRDGFLSHQAYKDKMRAKLKAQLKALEQPMLLEQVSTTFKEF